LNYHLNSHLDRFLNVSLNSRNDKLVTLAQEEVVHKVIVVSAPFMILPDCLDETGFPLQCYTGRQEKPVAHAILVMDTMWRE